MDLLREYLLAEREELLQNQIRLEAIGELDRLPPRVLEPLAALREATARTPDGAEPEMVLTLALSYGSREELARVAAGLAADAVAGRVSPASIDCALIQQRLATSRAARARPGPAHRRGVAPLQLPLVAGGLRRAHVPRGALAGVSRAPLPRRPARVPAARAALRVDLGPAAGHRLNAPLTSVPAASSVSAPPPRTRGELACEAAQRLLAVAGAHLSHHPRRASPSPWRSRRWPAARCSRSAPWRCAPFRAWPGWRWRPRPRCPSTACSSRALCPPASPRPAPWSWGVQASPRRCWPTIPPRRSRGRSGCRRRSSIAPCRWA